jgi:hypothetical protein
MQNTNQVESTLIDTVANFREVSCGNIAPGVLFRSSHPCGDDEAAGRIADIAGRANINCVINLCDTDRALRDYGDTPWYRRLVQRVHVTGLGIHDMVFPGDDFDRKFSRGLRFMLALPGPYLIHCYAGVDRTGFACAVLEAFMGATITEIIDDYLLSFKSQWHSAIVEPTGDTKSRAAVIIRQLTKMNEGEALTNASLQSAAERYMQKRLKLNDFEIEKLRATLSCSDMQ